MCELIFVTHTCSKPQFQFIYLFFFCKSRPFQPRKLLATGKKSSPELIVPSDCYWLQLAERPILAVGYSNNSWFLFFCFFEIHILHECLHKPAQYFYYFYLFPSTRLMCTYFRKEKERKLKFKKEWGWNMQHFESLERDKTWKKRERVAVKYSGRKSLPWLLIAKAFGRARKNFVCFFSWEKTKSGEMEWNRWWSSGTCCNLYAITLDANRFFFLLSFPRTFLKWKSNELNVFRLVFLRVNMSTSVKGKMKSVAIGICDQKENKQNASSWCVLSSL